MVPVRGAANVVTLSGFSINSKGKILDYNLETKAVIKEHSSECAFDVMNFDDKVILADWRIRKIAIVKNKSVFGTSEIMFRDYFAKKGKST
jgi:hypothetical protein